MWRYSAYGLVVQSELELPELLHLEDSAESADTPDVVIRLGQVDPLPQELDQEGFGFWCDADRACHFLKGSGAYLATTGREILVQPEPNATPAMLRLGILGPAMALIHMQRGAFVLHCSAVMMEGGAVAFLGYGGTGKSTMAAMLHARGHGLLTDDVGVLQQPAGSGQESVPHLVPSFPQIKLWPDAAASLGLAPDATVELHPVVDKRGWRPQSAKAQSVCVPLRRLYVLGVGEGTQVVPLPARDTLPQVMRHWYGARFGPKLLRGRDQGEHFRRCVEIANQVPMRGLLRPRISGSLQDHAAQVEERIRGDLTDPAR